MTAGTFRLRQFEGSGQVPIRIYALAKELKVDSKVLVDICNKVGITGKGSALASLSDDEATKIKDYFSKSKGAAASGSGRAAVGKGAASTLSRPLRREDYIAPAGGVGGKVPVLPGRPQRKQAPATRPEKKEPEASPEPPRVAEPVAEAPLTPPSPPETPPRAPEMPAKAPEMPPPLPPRVPPLSQKPPVLPEKPPVLPQKPSEGSEAPGKPPEKTAPSIKLAPIPTAAVPKKPKEKEPSPQKPDIKLPPDAIRAGKAGTKPLSEHLRKHEKKKAAAAKKTVTEKQRPAGALPLGEVPLPGRDRSRRASRAGAGAKDETAPALGGREARQLKRKRTASAKRRRAAAEEEIPATPRRRTHIKRTGTNTAAPRKGKIVVELPITVRGFSEAVGTPVARVLSTLMDLGTMSSITATLDNDVAELLAAELGVEVEFRQETSLENKLLASFQEENDPAALKPRPPIVTFLGHVDHGKTSLLDRIIGIDVVSGEKGGITQHIRAYRIEKAGGAIAFVDTPGHEAFTEMRARGANVTDVAVLVVAADDGVMPQTEEAISHARAADVPIVVALNKIDLPGVSPQRALEQLAANDLLPTEWGGDTEVIKTSALTGEGVDELLETLLTVAELHEYRANPDRQGMGTCLEAELQPGRGVVSKLLVQNGTLHVGDVIVCGSAFGRIKAMYDTLDPRKKHKQAGPSMPVNATGLNVTPGAGDRFYVLDDVSQARTLAEQRAAEIRQRELAGARQHVTLENLYEMLEEDQVQTLNIILRADVRGSIEAIQKELEKLEHPEVQIKTLQATVGGVSEADVHLADASDAVIIAFNVVPDEGARLLADQRGVQIRRYEIIYQVSEDLKAALEGMLKPEQFEKEMGRALVQQTFHISRLGTVAGCRVLMGTIPRDARVRVIRESRVIGDYPLDSLRREKDDVREVREGFECGMKLSGFNDLKEGDVLEAYTIEEVARTF